MTPERWLQVERIYHEAEARPPGERASFLDQACAGDAGLRGEVERMLAGDSEAAGFLEAPAVEMAARALAADAVRISPGSRLGLTKSCLSPARVAWERSTKPATRA